MAFTNAGLVNDGFTTHYQIVYDSALSQTGQNLANGLIAACEKDFDLMNRWFSGLKLIYNFPLLIQIANASGGAVWQCPSEFQVFLGVSPTTTLNAINGNSLGSINYLRFLLVSEVTEMFMASQNGGWFEESSLFVGGNEGTSGEGLSRFLAVQFQIQNGLGTVPADGGVSSLWLNSPRQDFITTRTDDHNPDPVSGSATLFIYYLFDQLGFDVVKIINAGAMTLSDVYTKLTGNPDGWTAFSALINSHYPPIPGFNYSPLGDSVFPVSELKQLFAPNQITCGYSESTLIFIDRPAMAEVNIQLGSDYPSLVHVPAYVTIPVGAMSASLSISTTAIPLPFSMKTSKVIAAYAGRSITIVVDVVPPTVESLMLTPNIVTCGSNSLATVKLNRPSLSGDVVVDVTCGAPGFATTPTQLVIPQGQDTATFEVNTTNILIPFPTAHAVIYATYASKSVSAVLTINPKMVTGILKSLVVMPAEVNGGQSSTGFVTLVGPVPVATNLGLAANDPTVGPGGGLPGGSTAASVPSSITIPAGETTGTFTIETEPVVRGTKRRVQIMAGGIVIKYAILTLDG
jgi:hypothetical protein